MRGLPSHVYLCYNMDSYLINTYIREEHDNLNYSESVHMRLSEDQKRAIMELSAAHKVSMSTTLRRMIEYCLSEKLALDAIVEPVGTDRKGDTKDGVV